MEKKFIICPSCHKAILSNSNYCYLCGQPISELAKQNEKIKSQNSQLQILNVLAKTIKDQSDLELIKGMIFKIKND